MLPYQLTLDRTCLGFLRSPGSALHSPSSGDLLPVAGIRSLVRPPDPKLHANLNV